MRTSHVLCIALSALAVALPADAQPAASSTPPNILILWGDDIGYWNVSAYNQGMMGYKTPNIDRIAKEGALFTDWYGQQSCTAGRASFITGQVGFRTGLLKVGLPGAKEGLSFEDPTVDQRFSGLPARRAGEPSEVASLVVFLASDESKFITGMEHIIDGGSTAGPAIPYQWDPETGTLK